MKGMFVRSMAGTAFAAVLCAWPGGAVRAADSEALGGFAGSLELAGPGLLFQPCLVPNSWLIRYPMEDGFVAPAKGAHRFHIRVSGDGPDERVWGTARVAQRADGGVDACWEVDPSAHAGKVEVSANQPI